MLDGSCYPRGHPLCLPGGRLFPSASLTPEEQRSRGAVVVFSMSRCSSLRSTGDKDYKDFATHVEAQAYFEGRGGALTNNVDRQEVDHGSGACESLLEQMMGANLAAPAYA